MVVFLLHTNELPLKYVFARLAGLTSGPDSLSGPNEKNLHGSVSHWPVTNFKQHQCHFRPFQHL